MVVTSDAKTAALAKHLTTTAKVPHRWNYHHDMIGYNYRMPNLNAALGCAQLEQLEILLKDKRQLAADYQRFFERQGFECVSEPSDCRSNYWLNAVLLDNEQERDEFLSCTNECGVLTRPLWSLMNRLPMFRHCQSAELPVAESLEKRLVALPSSPRTIDAKSA
jgi:dTDP-4-amino-4,6-dideoxygalactose transaminase